MSEHRKELQTQHRARFRFSGIADGIPTLLVAEVLDLNSEGALVEHERLFEPQSPCLLQLGMNGDLLTVRCRVLHSRARRSRPSEGSYYQTRVEFVRLNPAAKQLLETLLQSLGGGGGCEAAGP